MENFENSNITDPTINSLQINSRAKEYIKETANWAQFLSIIGFIFIGLLIVFSFFVGTIFSFLENEFISFPFPLFLFSALYLAIAFLYFFPVYYLYKFSSGVKKAISLNDAVALETSLKNLKSHYKFIGIFTMIIIGFYALTFVFAIIAGFMFG